jgi:hypothetical protein
MTKKFILIQGHQINPRRVSYSTGYPPIFVHGEETPRTRIVFCAGDCLIVRGKPIDISKQLQNT